MRLFGVFVPEGLEEAVAACRDHFRLAAGLSALVNLLYLAPTIYMIQVYDRAVPTGGVTTLLWLTVVVAFALATLAILDALRARVMLRASLRLDSKLSETIFDHIMMQRGRAGAAPQQAMREFDNLRAAVAGAPAIALFDIVWTPVYILVAFLVHPAIGALAIGASIALLAISVANERATRANSGASLLAMSSAYAAQDHVAQRSELVRALGMRRAMIRQLTLSRQHALQLTTQQYFDNGRYASLAKFVRLFLQSVALGLGALLAIEHQISAGSIIAASVLISRALQPIELLVGSWANIGLARQAIGALGSLLSDHGTSPHAKSKFELPAPRGILSARDVSVGSAAPGARPLLSGVSFDVKQGEFVGIIGPSGAGKTTLARVLSGAVVGHGGIVRIDGSDMRDWDPERLARHIGYLPQDAGLLPGTIADNISRFAGWTGEPAEAITSAVIAAAQCAGVHHMIVSLPGGYNRRIGANGDELSAGQRQRVALARALYGDPAVLILDEPNSALDAEGEAALISAIAAVRARNGTVLMVTHRAPLLVNASRLLLLVNGEMSMFGDYQDVLGALQRGSVKSAALAPAEVN